VTRNGRTELWHARAVPRGPTARRPKYQGSCRFAAIWTPDLLPTNDLPPWATNRSMASLLPADRQGIVQKTTTEAPAKASLLLVSPMGASLDIDAHWTSENLIGWRHQSYLGRDNYVRVEDAGYLFPFGFPAEVITVTERIISDGEAFLRTQQFIVIRRSSVDYNAGPRRAQPAALRRPQPAVHTASRRRRWCPRRCSNRSTAATS